MIYADISPRTTAYADRRLLTRAKFNNILAQFGQTRPVPKHKTQNVNFRGYNKLDSTPVQLQEGVTPTGKVLTKTDVPATIKQFGDWIAITDVILDIHEDPVLNESVDILGEQAPEMYDKVYAGVLRAGTNVVYSTGTRWIRLSAYWRGSTPRGLRRLSRQGRISGHPLSLRRLSSSATATFERISRR